MFLFFILFFFIILFYLFFNRKIHVDFASLFHRGFAKLDKPFGLYTYTGVQGEGKTYSAIKFCNKMKVKNNYTIVTNVSSYKVFSDTIYIFDIHNLIDFIVSHHGVDGKKYLIFFDEIFTVLMKNKAVDVDITSFLAQLRKREIIFVTTAQNWSEIPITFRRFCRFQISCHMFNVPILNRAFCINHINDGYNARWNNDIQDFDAPLLQTNFSKAEKSITEDYDTYETIKSLNQQRRRRNG